jgi:hypothetical protein
MATKDHARTGATDDPGAGGNSGVGDRAATERGAMTDADGGHMNYGGTDAAYEGMEDRNEGDAGDRANAVDRDDMRQPTGSTEEPPESGDLDEATDPGPVW